MCVCVMANVSIQLDTWPELTLAAVVLITSIALLRLLPTKYKLEILDRTREKKQNKEEAPDVER